eukprot:8325884-Alexandrium_andersonii.AAC.1
MCWRQSSADGSGRRGAWLEVSGGWVLALGPGLGCMRGALVPANPRPGRDGSALGWLADCFHPQDRYDPECRLWN